MEKSTPGRENGVDRSDKKVEAKQKDVQKEEPFIPFGWSLGRKQLEVVIIIKGN